MIGVYYEELANAGHYPVKRNYEKAVEYYQLAIEFGYNMEDAKRRIKKARSKLGIFFILILGKAYGMDM